MKKILAILSIISLFLGVSYAFASTLPTSIPSVYESYLSGQIGTSDTSLTVANATLRDGTSLSGYLCFTIDANYPTMEYVCGTASTTPTLITGLTRGIDAVTGTTSVTALKYTHRLGADIKISDYPILTLLTRIINGLDTFPNKITYGTTTTPTNANDILPKSYADSILATATSSIYSAFLNLTSNSQTVSGTNTFSAVQTFSAKPIFSVGATGITPVSTTDVAIKSYVDGVAIAGAPVSSNTTTGIGRSASSTQISTGYSSTTPYFIPSSLASSTASTTASIVVATNASGVIDSSFIASSSIPASALTGVYGNFGDGSDGNITISSPTTLTKDMYYNNLTVSNTLTTDGYKIFVKGTISGTSTIQWGTPNVGTAGTTNHVQGTGGTQSGSGQLKNVAGGNGAANGISNLSNIGAAGQAGGNGGSGGAANTTTGSNISPNNKFGLLSFSVFSFLDVSTTSTMNAYSPSGSAGGGAGGSNYSGQSDGGGGGGAGASGGTVFIAANTWAGTFTIKSIGGNGGGSTYPGGNSYSGGGGSGGNGGVSVVIFGTKTWSGSYTLTGGTGGTASSATSGATSGLNGLTGVSYELPIGSLLR